MALCRISRAVSLSLSSLGRPLNELFRLLDRGAPAPAPATGDVAVPPPGPGPAAAPAPPAAPATPAPAPAAPVPAPAPGSARGLVGFSSSTRPDPGLLWNLASYVSKPAMMHGRKLKLKAQVESSCRTFLSTVPKPGAAYTDFNLHRPTMSSGSLNSPAG